MATVTSFAEFLEAIQGSEDITLANDIDAQAEGYDYTDCISFSHDIDGQGHKISNLTIVSSKGYAFKLNETGGGVKEISDVIFENLLCKFRLQNSDLFYSYYDVEFTNCQIGAQLDFNSHNGLITNLDAYSTSLSSSSFADCALDITLKNHGGSYVTGYAYVLFRNTSFYRSNIVVREANLSSAASDTQSNSTIIDNLYNSALVLDKCTLSRDYHTIKGVGSYVCLHDCKQTNASTTVTGGSGMYFCNDSSDVTCNVSTVTNLTPAQLKDESYLRSIGFLP